MSATLSEVRRIGNSSPKIPLAERSPSDEHIEVIQHGLSFETIWKRKKDNCPTTRPTELEI